MMTPDKDLVAESCPRQRSHKYWKRGLASQDTCESSRQEVTQILSWNTLTGRHGESRLLSDAILRRESSLVWGPTDAGKTTLVKAVIDGLPEKNRESCIYWTGTASVRQLVGGLIHLLYSAGDVVVRKKVRDDGAGETSLSRWLGEQTSGRLKLLLYSAAQKGRYWFFLDQLPPATRSMAGLMKEIIWRCKTPVYLLARGCSQAEIGYGWSIYFTPEYHIRLGPLAESSAHKLLEQCIQRFGLASLNLNGFREEILRLSQHIPGSIVRMCEMAADPPYHYGDRVTVKLVHVDYLMRLRPSSAQHVRG